MALTKYERETIITFNEEEKDAWVYTHNRALKNRLARLREKYPDYFLVVREDKESITYKFPKKLALIQSPRFSTKKTKEKGKEEGGAKSLKILSAKPSKFTRKKRGEKES